MSNKVDRDHVPARTWLALCAAMMGAFLAVLNIQVTNASLNDIAGALGSSLDEASWISTSYLVAEIIIIGVSGWLCSVCSIKKYLLFSIVGFALSSALCALATSMNMMIVFRAIQGLTGGSLIPICFNLIFRLLPPPRRPVGMALFSITAVTAPAIGPTIGGILTDHYGWQWIFLMSLFPSAVMFWFTKAYLPEDKPNFSLLREGDYMGILCMAIGLGSLEFVLEEGERKDWFGNPLIVRFAVIGVIFFVLFLAIELLRQKPFINLRLYKDRSFTWASIVQFVLGVGMYGVVYLIPMYLAEVQRYNATDIGLTLMWVGIPQLFIIPFVPKLMKHIDQRLLCGIGVVMFGVSCFMNVPLDKNFAMEQLQLSNIVRAIGQPLVMVPILNLATSRLPSRESGSASALFNMTRNMGGSCGIAFLSTMLTRRENLHSVRLGESITIYSQHVRDRLYEMTQAFIGQGMDPLTAAQSSLKALQLTVREQAWMMSFSDNFYLIGVALMVTTLLILLIPRPRDYHEQDHSMH